ncbi:hypothetical protein HDU97_000794 [Phlyctochytrium planicorne]|nr:hypothetical protein HDU97_000794 [Phlyctochytrium planicorne]
MKLLISSALILACSSSALAGGGGASSSSTTAVATSTSTSIVTPPPLTTTTTTTTVVQVPTSSTPAPPAPTGLAAKLKKIVVLYMENRSFNNIAGYFNHTTDIDNLIQYKVKNGAPYCNPVNVNDANKGTICATSNALDRQTNDPDHSLVGVMLEQFGRYYANSTEQPAVPPMNGFVQAHANSIGSTTPSKLQNVIDGLSLDKVPITFALAKNFVLFDKWFASVPGPTNPNRAFATSGTAAGHGYNDNSFTSGTLTQRSIFQALSEAGKTWVNYDGSSSSFPGFYPDARFYSWVNKNAVKNVVPAKQFFTDVAAGKLPDFSYINPECCLQYSYHPPSTVASGEAYLKKVYEALRAAPTWNETALIISFDEHGGFGDHVPSPAAFPPGDNLSYSWSENGSKGVFYFDRYGVRVPTYIISPYVPAGVVAHGPSSGPQYDHTSVLKFIENLWNIPPFTLRDANAPDFAHLFSLDRPRQDAPLTL